MENREQKHKPGTLIRSESSSAFEMRGYYLVLGFQNRSTKNNYKESEYCLYSLRKQRIEWHASWVVNTYFTEA
tara:strand:- start:321 stop:539 length:219 start_codon:yes stop_codon:yes gene_type:complete